MSYRSGYTGPQVSKAVRIVSHPSAGAVLTFDSSANFPQHSTGKGKPADDSLEGLYFRDPITGSLTDDNGTLISSKYLFVDVSDNLIYRWKYLTEEQWLENNDDLSNYPSDGYAYVVCSGGGDIYWEELK